MPILPAEPEFHPKDLWDLESNPQTSLRWICLHTKPRQEKVVARHLLARGIGYYLPQATHEGRTPSGRKIRSTRPLFPSYLFMKGNDSQRSEVMRSNSLVNVLEISDQKAVHRDLEQIHRMLSSGLVVDPTPSHPVGVRVRVASGPLTGLKGTVVRRGSRDRFVAVVDFLGLGGSVELEDWQVERIDY